MSDVSLSNQTSFDQKLRLTVSYADGVRWTVTFALLIAGLSLSGWAHLLPWFGIVAIWVMRYNDISHPCFWFPLIFLMYGVSYFVVVKAGLLSAGPEYVFATKMHLVALVSYILGASRPAITPEPFLALRGTRQGVVIWTFFILALMISAIHYLGVLGTEGLSSKQDIRVAKGDNLALRLAPIYAPLAVFSGLVATRLLLLKSVYTGWFMGFLLMWGLAGLLITGERDIMLRFVIVIAFIWNFQKRRVSAKWALIGFIALIAGLPLMQAAKGALLGEFNEVKYGIYGLLGGEFKASGRVFTAILERWPGFMLGETFVWDFLRIISIGPLSIDIVSTSEWFNRIFIGHSGAGWGFSLVGEFYLNFGVPAVCLGFFLYGRVSYMLYRRQRRNPFFLVGYAVFTSVAVYSIRGDGATLVGSPIKLILMPMIVVFIFEQIAHRLAVANR